MDKMGLTVLKNGLNHVINFNKLNDKSIIVDLGSAIGDFVIEIQKHPNTKNTKIYCVECSKNNIDKFKKRCLPNTELIEYAIGGSNNSNITFTEFIGEIKSDGNFKYYQWGNTNNLYEDLLKGDNVRINKYEVPLINIQGLMEKLKLTQIDYLKMDVEGAEYETLFSLDKETASKIYQISLETHDKSRNDDLIKHLSELGFTIKKYENDEYYAYR